MKLRELEPQFLKHSGESWVTLPENSLIDGVKVDGIIFLCPRCFETNGGNVGTHSCVCWQPHIASEISPGPGRWEFLGTGFDNLTFRAGSSSVELQGGCNAHFMVENGNIRFV